MSERNGDRARFHKDHKRKLHHRQRIRALLAGLKKRADEEASRRGESLNMQDEGGPARNADADHTGPPRSDRTRRGAVPPPRR